MSDETQKYGMPKKTTFNNAVLPTQITSNCSEQKYMWQYHILVFPTEWTANVHKMQILQSETYSFMCDPLTKLHCDNFQHEILNLSLKKMVLHIFVSIAVHCFNKQMLLCTTKTANFVNTWPYKSRLLTANLWTHNTVTILRQVCKRKKKGGGRERKEGRGPQRDRGEGRLNLPQNCWAK
jgi:hypothetical protein